VTSIFSSTIIANPEILQFIFQSLPEPTFLLNKQGVYLEAWGGTDSERHHNPSYLVGLSQYDVLPAAQAAWFTQVIVESIEQNCAKELEYEVDPTQLPCFRRYVTFQITSTRLKNSRSISWSWNT